MTVYNRATIKGLIYLFYEYYSTATEWGQNPRHTVLFVPDIVLYYTILHYIVLHYVIRIINYCITLRTLRYNTLYHIKVCYFLFFDFL